MQYSLSELSEEKKHYSLSELSEKRKHFSLQMYGRPWEN
jgi:hypothetical protein